MSQPQPWIHSARFDLTLILAPAFLICAVVLFWRETLLGLPFLPAWAWLVLVVGVDVAHVYGTLFRTYLDTDEWRTRRVLYLLTPLVTWLAGIALYQLGALLFWRALAYLAVFHFVRQQYGLFAIYARHDARNGRFARLLDTSVIYAATMFPLLFWHLQPRQFAWFIADDFVQFDWPLLTPVCATIYAVLVLLYLGKETVGAFQTGYLNVPKNLLLGGTALSWLLGIVVFDNDLIFTATNVCAHGIPYLALIWLYGRNRTLWRASLRPVAFSIGDRLFTPRAWPVYLGILVVLAFIEEGVWDGLIWREHPEFFTDFFAMPAITSEITLAWLVPLLAVPQATHYVLDAYIWRMTKEHHAWKHILFYQANLPR